MVLAGGHHGEVGAILALAGVEDHPLPVVLELAEEGLELLGVLAIGLVQAPTARLASIVFVPEDARHVTDAVGLDGGGDLFCVLEPALGGGGSRPRVPGALDVGRRLPLVKRLAVALEEPLALVDGIRQLLFAPELSTMDWWKTRLSLSSRPMVIDCPRELVAWKDIPPPTPLPSHRKLRLASVS